MQYVQAAEGLLRERHHALQVLPSGDVGVDEGRLPAGSLDEGYGLLPACLVDIGDDDGGPRLPQRQRGCPADAGAAAGNQGHLARWVHAPSLLASEIRRHYTVWLGISEPHCRGSRHG